MDESKVVNLPKGTCQCDVHAWRAYVASIPCETQSVTTVASFMARVTRAVVVLAVVVVTVHFAFAISVAAALVATEKALVCTEVDSGMLLEVVVIGVRTDELIKMLAAVMLGDGVDIFAGVDIIVSTTVTHFAFAILESYTLDLVVDVLIGTLVAALTDVSGDGLADVNTNVLVAAVYILKLDMRSQADKSSC